MNNFGESVWLLWGSGILVVVSSKWEQGSDLMPSCAKICWSISVETTKITTHEWKSEKLILVDVLDRSYHILDPRPVVS